MSCLGFSPDGTILASGSGDKTIRLWDLDVQSWMKRARQIANRKLTPEERERYIGKQETFSGILQGWLVEHGLLSQKLR